MSTGNKTYKQWAEELEPQYTRLIMKQLPEALHERESSYASHMIPHLNIGSLPVKLQYTLNEVLSWHHCYKRKTT